MRTAILLALTLLLIAPAVLAGERWQGKKVVVYDHTVGDWRSLVQSNVAATVGTTAGR